MFIERTDLQQIARDHFVETILNDDNTGTIFASAVGSAVSQAREYLVGLYDVDRIFSAKGTARHAYLVRVICYITRYIIYDRAPGVSGTGKGMPSKAEKDYDDCLAWLRDLRSGAYDSELPRKPAPGTNKPATVTRYGTDKRRTLDY